MYFGVLGVFVLYIDVLNVSMRFIIRLCIYESIFKNVSRCGSTTSLSKMTGMQHLFAQRFCLS